MLATLALCRGGLAADDTTGVKNSAPQPSAAAPSDKTAAAIVLAGRWSGERHGTRARREGGDTQLLYDIVPCGQEWCGIAVGKDNSCGAIGLRLTHDTTPGREHAFSGSLELAKGTAPYTVEAWAEAADGEASARLSIVGDTGSREMLFMRRSFPLEAHLARLSDAQCTLAKATS